MLVGIGGSFIAGLIFYVISDGQARGAGFLAAFTCSVAIVYVIRRRRGGDLTHPGRDPRTVATLTRSKECTDRSHVAFLMRSA